MEVEATPPRRLGRPCRTDVTTRLTLGLRGPPEPRGLAQVRRPAPPNAGAGSSLLRPRIASSASMGRSTLCNIIVGLRPVEDPRQVARTLKSVDHALAVMEFLAVTGPQTLTALSQRFDMPKGTMHRSLATLRFHGYVAEDPITARYSFGVTATRLAQRADAAESRAKDSKPTIRWRWQNDREDSVARPRWGRRSNNQNWTAADPSCDLLARSTSDDPNIVVN